MGEVFFVCGSVVGAVLAWLVGRGDRRRSTVGALTGASCGLLGALTAISGGTMAPMTQAGFGLLSAAAPFTLCVTPGNPAAGTTSAVRRYSAALLLALVYGIGCATLGFVSVAGVWHLSHKSSVGESAGHLIMAPNYSGTACL